MTANVQSEKLPTRTKLLYGVGDVGNAVINSAVQFFLLVFYTDGVLIPAALAGSALVVGKIIDAIAVPLLGWMGDRTHSRRFGRRRVYMIFGALPLALSIILMWRVPLGLGPAGQFIWIAATYTLFSVIWCATNVPYYALTTELTEDYDERSSLTTFRMVISVPAYLVGAALTPAIAALFVTKQMGYGWVGVIYGAIAAAALLICAAGIREKDKIMETVASLSIWKSFRQTFTNPFFVRLVIAYSIINISFAFVKTLMAYFLRYQMNMADQVPIAMGLLLVAVMAFVFPWKILSEKWDKGPAYALGMGIGALAVAASFFLSPDNKAMIYVMCIVAGMGFSAQWVFPWSMVPDVADYDRLKTGEYRSGMYFGVWTFISTVTEALAVMASGWVLTLFNYVPNVAQAPSTLFGIRLFFGPVPALVILLALPLLVWYPLTRRRHQQLIRDLEGQTPAGQPKAQPSTQSA
jgi:glycoside/pentoside/hexuronide:cation symporter, GPH family